MLKEAEEEFILVTTEEGITRKADYLLRAFKKASERGVKIKIAAPLKGELSDSIKLLSKYAEIRSIKNIEARFAIADGKEITFLLFNDEEIHPSYDVGVWVNTPFFASAVADLFDLAWKELEIIKLKN
jgi:sugar-specific transcriptional regulator TrmB